MGKAGASSLFCGLRADVLIDARLLAYRRGGIARYASNLVRWLPLVAPDIAAVPFANRPTSELSGDVSRVFTPPHHHLESWTLGPELSLRRPRLVHSVDFIAPRTIGIRHVVTVHDLAFLDHPEGMTAESRRYYGQIDRSIEIADRVICVSAFTADTLGLRFPIAPDKIVTIWNGADAQRESMTSEQAIAVVRAKLGAETSPCVLGERPVLLVVGTIEPRKRAGLLLRAMTHDAISQRTPRPLLVLVGQRGWNCDEIIEEINTGQERGDVIWIDSADDDLLGAMYSTATILVMPSRDEGFGLPVLEAMQAGLPVIAADAGALPEIAGDAAVLEASDAPDGWANAIARLLDHQGEREALRQRGMRRAKAFTWEQTARQTADVYREVLAQ